MPATATSARAGPLLERTRLSTPMPMTATTTRAVKIQNARDRSRTRISRAATSRIIEAPVKAMPP